MKEQQKLPGAYLPREGGVCPLCWQPRCPETSPAERRDGYLVRAHHCPRCGNDFMTHDA